MPFAVGLPLGMALVELAFPPLYRPGSVASALLVGVIVGLALILVARERRRYRAAAIDHTGDLEILYEYMFQSASRKKVAGPVTETGAAHLISGLYARRFDPHPQETPLRRLHVVATLRLPRLGLL